MLKQLLMIYAPDDNLFLLILCFQPYHSSSRPPPPRDSKKHQTSILVLCARDMHGLLTKVTQQWCACVCVCTCDFWCTSRHSSKWARVRSTDFLTLLREVLFCHVSPSAMLWYQSGCTVFWSAMNLATVNSIRPPLPHTDTV